MLFIILCIWFGLVLLGLVFSWNYSLKKDCPPLTVILHIAVSVIGLIGFMTILSIAEPYPKYCILGSSPDCMPYSQKEIDEAFKHLPVHKQIEHINNINNNNKNK